MKIIIPGIPVPQARMKRSSRGGFVRMYDPKAKEKSIIKYGLTVYKSNDVVDFPRISFLFHMPIPASIPKKERLIYESGMLKHDKKPDADNLVKLYLDCLDGIVIQGDQKVSMGPSIKVYHPEPKTIIWLTQTTRMLSPWELDFVYLDALERDIPYFCARDFPSDSESLWRQAAGLFHHS